MCLESILWPNMLLPLRLYNQITDIVLSVRVCSFWEFKSILDKKYPLGLGRSLCFVSLLLMWVLRTKTKTRRVFLLSSSSSSFSPPSSCPYIFLVPLSTYTVCLDSVSSQCNVQSTIPNFQMFKEKGENMSCSFRNKSKGERKTTVFLDSLIQVGKSGESGMWSWLWP